jgi:hypothetical protein
MTPLGEPGSASPPREVPPPQPLVDVHGVSIGKASVPGHGDIKVMQIQLTLTLPFDERGARDLGGALLAQGVVIPDGAAILRDPPR